MSGSVDFEKNKSIPEERQSPSQVIEKIVEVPVEVIKYVKVEKIVEKKVPRIRGASPENGAQNLIRNAFVSARMELLDNYQGVDAKSVSAESIRLYPASNPEEPVEVYITINNGLKNILLEPLKVLKPNTEYIFEINSLYKKKVETQIAEDVLTSLRAS